MLLTFVSFIVPCIAASVAADTASFNCIENGVTHLKTCFASDWPSLTICPNHFWAGIDDYINADTVKETIADMYTNPARCIKMKNAKDDLERCEHTIQAVNVPGRKPIDYTFLWTWRTMDQDQVPHYTYGGIYWHQVIEILLQKFGADHLQDTMNLKSQKMWCFRCDHDKTECAKYPR